MFVVYVAGPYRAKSEWALEINIRAAEALSLELWRAGFAAVCPHKNTAHFGGACDDSVWLDGDLEIMRRCDAVVLVPGWQASSGTRAEVDEANRVGLPVFESVRGLQEWLEAEKSRAGEGFTTEAQRAQRKAGG